MDRVSAPNPVESRRLTRRRRFETVASAASTQSANWVSRFGDGVDTVGALGEILGKSRVLGRTHVKEFDKNIRHRQPPIRVSTTSLGDPPSRVL